jgi:hypothetical protein
MSGPHLAAERLESLDEGISDRLRTTNSHGPPDAVRQAAEQQSHCRGEWGGQVKGGVSS